MYQSKHKDFIEAPLINLCKDVIASADCLENGIEFMAVSAQILHSLFLQLTGAQEQKMKCICWDLATDDYDYRYKRYKNWDLNECSKLDDKNSVFGDLICAIKKLKPKYKMFSGSEKKDFIDNVIAKIKNIFDNSNIVSVYPGKYREFCEIVDRLDEANIAAGEQQIFTGSKDDSIITDIPSEHILSVTYGFLYMHRNRCAHNTLSYQQNIPTLNELQNSKQQKLYNIFLFIAILIIIDELTIKAYKKYQKCLYEC